MKYLLMLKIMQIFFKKIIKFDLKKRQYIIYIMENKIIVTCICPTYNRK